MGKYSIDLKLKITKENELGYGYKFLGKKYNISSNTIKNWCNQYKMYGEDGLKKSMSKNKYTGEFKLSVLNYRKANSLSYRETAEHFEIKQISTIANWQIAYDKDGITGLFNPIVRPNKTGESNMTNKNKIKEFKKLTESEK